MAVDAHPKEHILLTHTYTHIHTHTNRHTDRDTHTYAHTHTHTMVHHCQQAAVAIRDYQLDSRADYSWSKPESLLRARYHASPFPAKVPSADLKCGESKLQVMMLPRADGVT